MTEERIPYVGATVHFVAALNGQPVHVFAFISAIANVEAKTPSGPQMVEVAVLEVHLPNGVQFGQQAIQDEVGRQPGTWHWIEKPTRLVGANGNRIST